MNPIDALRRGLEGLAGILTPRQPRLARVEAQRRPRLAERPRRSGAGGVYRPLRG